MITAAPSLICPHCEGPARVVVNGLCNRCREEDEFRERLAASERREAEARAASLSYETTAHRATKERDEARAERDALRAALAASGDAPPLPEEVREALDLPDGPRTPRAYAALVSAISAALSSARREAREEIARMVDHDEDIPARFADEIRALGAKEGTP